MTPIQIMDKLETCQLALTRGNSEMKTLAISKAKAEKEYRTALAKEILRLRVEKFPSSLAGDLARGSDNVAELRLKRDIAESAYFTAISAMDNLRIEIESLRSLLTWMRVELKNT